MLIGYLYITLLSYIYNITYYNDISNNDVLVMIILLKY